MLFVIQFSCFQQVLHRGKLIFNETTFASKPNSNKFRKETRLQNNTIFRGLKFSFKIVSSMNFYFEKVFILMQFLSKTRQSVQKSLCSLFSPGRKKVRKRERKKRKGKPRKWK